MTFFSIVSETRLKGGGTPYLGYEPTGKDKAYVLGVRVPVKWVMWFINWKWGK